MKMKSHRVQTMEQLKSGSYPTKVWKPTRINGKSIYTVINVVLIILSGIQRRRILS